MHQRNIKRPAHRPAVNMKEAIIAATADYIPARKRIAIHIGIMDQYTVIGMQERNCQTRRVAARSMDAIAVRKGEALTARNMADHRVRPPARVQATPTAVHIRRTNPLHQEKKIRTTCMITSLRRISPMTSMKSSMITRMTMRMKTKLMMQRRITGTIITDIMLVTNKGRSQAGGEDDGFI